MQICILLTTLGAAALIWFLIEKLKKYSVKAAFIKSLVSALFVAVGILGWFLSVRERGLSGPGMFILLGLIFGLMGDIWLDLKYVFPQEDDALTYAGFAAFGAGHVLYITGLILRFYPEGNFLWEDAEGLNVAFRFDVDLWDSRFPEELTERMYRGLTLEG